MPTKRKQHTPGKVPRASRNAAGNRRTGGASRKSSARHTSSVNRPGRKSGFSTSRGTSPFTSPKTGSYQTGAKSVPSSPAARVSNNENIPTLTRRNLLIGAGALAGVAVVGGGASAAISALGSSGEDTLECISVPESAVEASDDYSEVSFSDVAALTGSFKLTYGTQVWADTDTVAACLVPAETSSPLNTVSLLYLGSGNTAQVLEGAQGAEEGFQIFDVRCSESILVWTELNTYEGIWRIYTANISNGNISDIKQVDEGDSNWMTPSITAAADAAFWQVMPASDGDAADEKSVVRGISLGKKKYKEVCSSKRAFPCRITSATDGVVVAPRADSTSTYYTLTKIKASDFSIADEMTLPDSMTPDMIGYGKSGFSFAFSSIYNYGGGIAQMGTYTPKSAVNEYNYNDLSWFHFSRSPLASPCWCGGWFVMKSTTALCGINFANKSYFVTPTINNADDYGEYLVSNGTTNSFVGISQITPDGEDAYAQVNVYTPNESVSSLF